MAVSTVCTPTKTFERVELSPNCKDTLCLQCGKHVKDLDKRRRLFSGHKKTNVCENIELLIGRVICSQTTLTNVICRSCGDKNTTLVKKINSVKEQFASVASTMAKDHGESATKRQYSQAEEHDNDVDGYQQRSNQCGSTNPVKRRVLFSTTTEINSQQSPESEQKMEALSVSEGTSSVSVSIVEDVFYMYLVLYNFGSRCWALLAAKGRLDSNINFVHE
jgi:hypothetical protein